MSSLRSYRRFQQWRHEALRADLPALLRYRQLHQQYREQMAGVAYVRAL